MPQDSFHPNFIRQASEAQFTPKGKMVFPGDPEWEKESNQSYSEFQYIGDMGKLIPEFVKNVEKDFVICTTLGDALNALKHRIAFLEKGGVNAQELRHAVQNIVNTEFSDYLENSKNADTPFKNFFPNFIHGLELVKEMQLEHLVIVKNLIIKKGVMIYFIDYLQQIIKDKHVFLNIKDIRTFSKNLVQNEITSKERLDSFFSSLDVGDGKTLLDYINKDEDDSLR